MPDPPNRQLENVPTFRPPVNIKNGLVPVEASEKEFELQDQIDGAGFESIYLTL